MHSMIEMNQNSNLVIMTPTLSVPFTDDTKQRNVKRICKLLLNIIVNKSLLEAVIHEFCATNDQKGEQKWVTKRIAKRL